MNSSKKTNDASDLIETLVKSTVKYVARQIKNDVNRKAYTEGAKTAFEAIRSLAPDDAAKLLSHKREKFPGLPFVGIEIFSDYKTHFLLGFDHVTDVAISISNRF
jgi:hypothetical protein